MLLLIGFLLQQLPFEVKHIIESEKEGTYYAKEYA